LIMPTTSDDSLFATARALGGKQLLTLPKTSLTTSRAII